MGKKALAELFGTFWLVLGGCGSAVLSAGIADIGIGLLGVAIAFGLTVVTMAYSIGHISGSHLNPAVTVGLWAGGRFPGREIPYYIAAQVIGAIIAAFVIFAIASGQSGFVLAPNGLAVNGVGDLSPGGYSLQAGILVEVVLTAFFLIVIMGSTHSRAPAGFAPLAIGLGLTLIHLISIPVTNTSVNPARSTGPAIIVGGLALQQLWIFWVAPIVGGILGGFLYRRLEPEAPTQPEIKGG
jgi:aquaporin Z